MHDDPDNLREAATAPKTGRLGGRPHGRCLAARSLSPLPLADNGDCKGNLLDWSALVPRLIYPTKVWIIEAMQWLEKPLSARDLEGVFRDEKSLSLCEYHLLSLAEAGIVEVVHRRRVRGACESPYFFTAAVWRPSQSVPY